MSSATRSHLLQRLAAAAARAPELTAVVAGGEACSRASLQAFSDKLAAGLLHALAGKHPIVALRLDKSYAYVAAIVACLKSGTTFVPISKSWPEARQLRILDIVKPSLLVTDDGAHDASPYPTSMLQDLASATTEPQQATFDNPIAYVIFTSGSTGEPKGVQISSNALDEFARNIEDVLPLRDDAEVLVNLAELSFDQSVMDWVFLLLGKGPLHLLAASTNPMDLVGYIAKHRISYISSVANTFALMMRYRSRIDSAQLETLSVICCGGSALFSTTARELREVVPRARLYNLFGPTEATVYCAGVELTPQTCLDEATVSIGGPFSRQTLLFDSGTTVSDRPGDMAELLILGTQLMSGYVGAESGLETISWKGQRLTCYRSGDLFKEANGQLYFVSRKSGFIKSRGYRVSPIEIESSFLAHADIVECACVGIPDTVAENVLVLFYVAREPVTHDELVAFGDANLASYCVPREFVQLSELPKSSSGKTNYAKLKEQFAR